MSVNLRMITAPRVAPGNPPPSLERESPFAANPRPAVAEEPGRQLAVAGLQCISPTLGAPMVSPSRHPHGTECTTRGIPPIAQLRITSIAPLHRQAIRR